MKNIYLELILLVVLLSNVNDVFAQEDTNKPVLNTISLSNENIQAGDDLTFVINITDDISGINYALGNYDKAIEYAKLREKIDYNKKWKYNLEIAEKRKKIVKKNKE